MTYDVRRAPPAACRWCGAPAILWIRREDGDHGACRACALDIARERDRHCVANHTGHLPQKLLVPDPYFRGYRGEIQFAVESGLPWDARDKPGGDGGIDFRARIGTIDVVTAETFEPVLRRDLAKYRADLFVLAHTRDGETTLRGWCWRDTLLAAKVERAQTGDTRTLGVAQLSPPRWLLDLLDDVKVDEEDALAIGRHLGNRYDDDGRLLP